MVSIGGKRIGEGAPCFIIAETACSHNGSMEIAHKLVQAAAEAKADAINFQMTTLPAYMVPQYGSGRGRVSAGKESEGTVYQYLTKLLHFTEEKWQELFTAAKQRGLLVSATCNDLSSLGSALRLGVDCVQIHSGCIGEEALVRAAAKSRKPLCLKIGACTLHEIEQAVQWASSEGNTQLMLMHGFQNYPTKLDDVHLRFIATLQQLFGFPAGFADHTDGGDLLALVVPLLALPFGAAFLEKHLTHDRAARAEDFESALNPGDFARFVQWVRAAEKTIGSAASRPFSEDELNYRNVVKKRLVANCAIAAGELFTQENVTAKRSDEGLQAEMLSLVAGKRARTARQENNPIMWEHVQ